MLESNVLPGKTKTIIEYSSGSTVISMSMIARVMHGIDDTRAYLSNKTSDAKLKLMQFFGLNISLFGGPSQPEPYDERGGIQSARRMATESDEILNPNQYENDKNWQSHIRWTGPQIFKQLPEITVLCAGMGTSGTMTGLGTYFKQVKPTVLRLGVCTAPGDRVPGPRSFALMKPVEFPWKEAVDVIEEVNSYDSFSLSLDLCREGIVCGPSSGFNLQGLFQMLEKRKKEGTLSELAGPDGVTHCVFLCCDLPYQYIGEYFSRLGEDKFHPIKNEVRPVLFLFLSFFLYARTDMPRTWPESTSTATTKAGSGARSSCSRTFTPLRPRTTSWTISPSAPTPASSISAPRLILRNGTFLDPLITLLSPLRVTPRNPSRTRPCWRNNGWNSSHC